MAIRKRTGNSAVLAFLLLAASAGILGCGSKTASVAGKVSYRNKLVTSGEVMFITQDGRAGAHAPVQPDGTYRADNVPPGKLKVGLQNPVPMYYQQVQNGGKRIANNPEMQEAAKRATLYVPTPPTYADPDQSGLTTEVKPGKNEYNIEMK
jgi:hypothetical protein